MPTRYTLAELEALPTLAVGQADDLKVDEGHLRVWLSRCGPEDGERFPNRVTVEVLNEDGWHITDEYQAV